MGRHRTGVFASVGRLSGLCVALAVFLVTVGLVGYGPRVGAEQARVTWVSPDSAGLVTPSGSPGARPDKATPGPRAPAPPAAVAPSASRTAPASRPATSAPAPVVTSAKATSAAPAVTAVYTTFDSWQSGYMGRVTVRNVGNRDEDWTVVVTFVSGTTVDWSGGADASNSGDTMTFRAKSPLAPGDTAKLEFRAWSSKFPHRPKSCTIAGQACR